MNNILLFEKFISSQYAPLYVAKKKFIALETFKDDVMKGNIFGGEDKQLDFRKGEYYIQNKQGKNNIIGVSLTRNKDLRFNPSSEAVSDTQFTFDTQKLKSRYRIIPYDYYNTNISLKKTESEELLVGDIKNVGKYILNIEFNSDTIYDFTTESEKIDFFWSVGKFLEKYPHITISSVNYFGRPNKKITKDFFIEWMNKIKTGDFKDISLKAA